MVGNKMKMGCKECGKSLKIYGNKAAIEAAEEAIKEIHFTGNTNTDSIALQDLKGSKKLKASLIYEGRTIYPFEPIVKEIKSMIDTGSIRNISKRCYEFFYLNFDIAHYDLYGYIDYYDGCWSRLYTETLEHEWQKKSTFLGSTVRIIEAVQQYMIDKENGVAEKPRKRIRSKKTETVEAAEKPLEAGAFVGIPDEQKVFFQIMGLACEPKDGGKQEVSKCKKKKESHQTPGQTNLFEVISELAG